MSIEYRVASSKFKKKISLVAFFILILNSLLVTRYLSAQPTGAAFLDIPVGARAVGLGSAFTSMVDDSSALYWNPAGIGRIGITDLMASHNEWIADTKESFVGVAQRLHRTQVIGISYMALYMDPLETRDDSGNQTGTFDAKSQAVGISWAMNYSSVLSIGATAKQIQETIDGTVANGTAMDFGFQMRPMRHVSVGASLLNVGPSMKYVSESYSLPTAFRGGVGFGIGPLVTLAFDAKKELTSAASDPEFSMGMEYNMSNLSRSYFWTPVVWRFGYLAPSGPAIGFGMKVLGSRIDYALTPMSELGLTHRASFNLRFGRPPGVPRPRPAKSISSAKVASKKSASSGVSNSQSTTKTAAASETSKKSADQSNDEPKESGKSGTVFDFLFGK